MQAVTSKVTSKDGTQIAFERAGSGPPLILVDGALCHRAFGASPELGGLLADRFTVFLYDRRGRNQSGDTLPYAVQREVEDLAALVDAAGGSAYIFGISSGAALTLHAAASGLNFPKVAIYEVPYFVTGRRPPLDAAAQVSAMIREGRRGDAVEFFMVEEVGQPREEAAAMRGAPFWPALEAVAHTIAYDAEIMGNWQPPVSLLKKITAPVLVADGGASPEPMRLAAQAVAGALPNATYRTLPGQTHQVASDALAPVLAEFFGK